MYILMGLVAFLLLGTIINQIMVRIETKKYKHLGKLIEIDGHKMHITGEGTGQPTVVMTCASGSWCGYTDFYCLNEKLSDITRTCIYERPGIGWSEHASTSRNTEQIVSDLHTLLLKAGEKPPYILVAHSLGAMEMLQFAYNYPDEVAGIVLIDGAGPNNYIVNQKVISVSKKIMHCYRFLNFIGIVRILTELKFMPPMNHRIKNFPKEIGKLDKAMLYKNLANSMSRKELDSMYSTSLKMNEQLDLKDLPMFVYTVKDTFSKITGWDETVKGLLGFSTGSKQIMLDNTNHSNVILDSCDEIVEGIKEIIRINEAVRNS